MNYKFDDLKKSKEYIPNTQDPKEEGFTFNGFSSYANGYFLISRDAPVPTTRSEETVIPYIQGALDFSFYRGIRYFNNRKITFKIFKPNLPYSDIKTEITTVRTSLLSQQASNEILRESYTQKNSYWRGTCQDVSYEEINGGLLLTVEFSLYPLLFVDIDPAEADIWDDFNFCTGVAQEYQLSINCDCSTKFINFSYAKRDLHAQVTAGDVNNGAFVKIHNQTTPLKNTKNEQYIGNLEVGSNLIEFKNIHSEFKLDLLFTAEILC